MLTTKIYLVTNCYGNGDHDIYIGKTKKLQVLKSDTVHEIYTVVTILRNCHAALYGYTIA